ncbi:MAG: MSHA biogenesis protein MshI [Parashewanella sp.]
MDNILRKMTFWRKQKSVFTLGLYLTQSSLWLYCPETNEQAPICREIPVDNNQWKSAFSIVAADYPNASIQLVLGFGRYQLLQIDKPAADEDTISQVLLMAVKDLVTYPIHEIHLDHFASPQPNKVNVVVCERSKLQSLIVAAQEAGLSFNGISIEELMLTHLYTQDGAIDDSARLILFQKNNSELLLAIIKSGELLLQRRVRGFHALDAMTREDIAYGVADNLSIEIQRSMDFYESQLRQAPVSQIQVLVENIGEPLAQALDNNFGQSVQAMTSTSMNELIAQLALKEHELEAMNEKQD